MCGIAGSFGDLDRARVRRMTDAIVHRGPDSSGHHSRGEIHLGARRLRIIDLDSGDQPIYNEAGDKAIVFNGEIYNYRELQDHLRARGHRLATRSDTEVVLHLYEEYGRDCVQHLRGMFAFAIEDGGSLFLARDRLGIKPLYYAHLADRGLFLFASETKAILSCPEVSAELDRQAVVDSLLMTHLIGSGTLFREVRQVDPGTTMEVRRDGERLRIETHRYYRPSFDTDESIGREEAQAELHRLLEETVAGHLVADVEVALLLSGGLDSGLLAALMHRIAGSFRAFSAGTEDDHPDLAIARGISAGLGIEQEVVVPTFDEYLAAIPEWVRTVETLTTLSGLASLLLARRIGPRIKVCLSGEGSDEIFGGYPEFNGRFRNFDYLQSILPRIRAAGHRPSAPVIELVRELAARRRESPEAYLRALFRYHQGDVLVRNHLDYVDRSGMAASVEIRVPYMDHVLVDFVNRLPLHLKVDLRLSVRKYLLRRLAVESYSPLLTDAALRRKLGMPQACSNFRQRFDELCAERLPLEYLQRHELGELFPNRRQLLIFELYETIFVEHRGHVPEGLDILDFIRQRAEAVPPARHTVAMAGGG